MGMATFFFGATTTFLIFLAGRRKTGQASSFYKRAANFECYDSGTTRRTRGNEGADQHHLATREIPLLNAD
jgi:hypothetical protein